MLLASSFSREEFERACVAFWTIWNDWNRIYHGKSIIEDVQVRCGWILNYWNEFRGNDNSNIPSISSEECANHEDYHGICVFTDVAIHPHKKGDDYVF